MLTNSKHSSFTVQTEQKCSQKFMSSNFDRPGPDTDQPAAKLFSTSRHSLQLTNLTNAAQKPVGPQTQSSKQEVTPANTLMFPSPPPWHSLRKCSLWMFFPSSSLLPSSHLTRWVQNFLQYPLSNYKTSRPLVTSHVRQEHTIFWNNQVLFKSNSSWQSSGFLWSY